MEVSDLGSGIIVGINEDSLFFLNVTRIQPPVKVQV